MSGRKCKLCSNPAAREKAVGLRDGAASYADIAAELGLGRSSVHRCLTKHESPVVAAETSPTIAVEPTVIEAIEPPVELTVQNIIIEPSRPVPAPETAETRALQELAAAIDAARDDLLRAETDVARGNATLRVRVLTSLRGARRASSSRELATLEAALPKLHTSIGFQPAMAKWVSYVEARSLELEKKIAESQGESERAAYEGRGLEAQRKRAVYDIERAGTDDERAEARAREALLEKKIATAELEKKRRQDADEVAAQIEREAEAKEQRKYRDGLAKLVGEYASVSHAVEGQLGNLMDKLTSTIDECLDLAAREQRARTALERLDPGTSGLPNASRLAFDKAEHLAAFISARTRKAFGRRGGAWRFDPVHYRQQRGGLFERFAEDVADAPPKTERRVS